MGNKSNISSSMVQEGPVKSNLKQNSVKTLKIRSCIHNFTHVKHIIRIIVKMEELLVIPNAFILLIHKCASLSRRISTLYAVE